VSLWRRVFSLDELNASSGGTMMQPLDIVFTELGADFLRASMPVDARTHQPYGLLHGGASVTLAETVGSTASHMCIDTQRSICVGQEINANHLRAVRSGRVTATARPIHVGSRSHVWGIEIVNEAGSLVCISRLTMAVLERPNGPDTLGL
jgi:1,4-dihydroxy-2-naphthoyl-CoA hydrolase